MTGHSLATPDIELMIAMWSTHSKAPPLCSPQRGGCVHDDHKNDDHKDDDDNYDTWTVSWQTFDIFCSVYQCIGY